QQAGKKKKFFFGAVSATSHNSYAHRLLLPSMRPKTSLRLCLSTGVTNGPPASDPLPPALSWLMLRRWLWWKPLPDEDDDDEAWCRPRRTRRRSAPPPVSSSSPL